MKNPNQIERRDFIKSTAMIATGTLGMTSLPNVSWSNNDLPPEEMENVIGPRKGYAPHIGTLASMMTWMRSMILRPVKGMTVDQLDYIHDKNSNSIGAMLLHLAATERFYQIHTFEKKQWGDWSEKDKETFQVAMRLGEPARTAIKGNNLDYYLNILSETREQTLNEFRNRDDEWLMEVDTGWAWGPTNNYCKWFHVCEHESNHNGQIKWIKKRLPVGNASAEKAETR